MWLWKCFSFSRFLRDRCEWCHFRRLINDNAEIIKLFLNLWFSGISMRASSNKIEFWNPDFFVWRNYFAYFRRRAIPSFSSHNPWIWPSSGCPSSSNISLPNTNMENPPSWTEGVGTSQTASRPRLLWATVVLVNCRGQHPLSTCRSVLDFRLQHLAYLWTLCQSHRWSWSDIQDIFKNLFKKPTD